MKKIDLIRRLAELDRRGVFVFAKRDIEKMFPQETEKSPGTTKRRVVSPQAVQNDLRVIRSQLSEPGGTIWLVFAGGTYDGQQLLVPAPDSLLVEELRRVGFEFRSANLKDAGGIFAFSRQASACGPGVCHAPDSRRERKEAHIPEL